MLTQEQRKQAIASAVEFAESVAEDVQDTAMEFCDAQAIGTGQAVDPKDVETVLEIYRTVIRAKFAK